MNELALFAGAGGGILAGRLLGWRTIAACEIEPYPRAVLLHNQELGNLPPFPIWDDVSTFDGKPWRGLVDVVSGGFPCQDISCAGKGAGIIGARSGLWAEMHRIICEVRPRYAFMENSPMLTSRGLGRVLGDLAEIGYHASWCVLGAADVGAPHRRDRMWIVAEDMDWNANRKHDQTLGKICGGQNPHPRRVCRGVPHLENAPGERLEEPRKDPGADNEEIEGRTAAGACGAGSDAAHPHLPGCQEQRSSEPAGAQLKTTKRSSWWSFEPRVGRVAHGVASRVDRLKALGNGQVPLVAATAFQILKNRLDNIQP